jgi:quinolinate synthase
MLNAQQALPIEGYRNLSQAELDDRIWQAKEALKERLLILGHHYQQDDVYKFADYGGDSLKLSQYAAQSDREVIVFCGVHFMAETADILTSDDQKVILPDLTAGCSMADMADLEKVESTWDDLTRVLGKGVVTPITYINSAADLKAFCGLHDGVVCTSSNADRVLRWAFSRREKVLFFPDQHLGRNTALKMGIPREEIIEWDRGQPMGGQTPEAIRKARVILWNGFCSVHMVFQPQHITYFRAQYPDIRVIVHPECTEEVVALSDSCGSTEHIINTVTASPSGSVWAVGTELNLVNRLKQNLPDKKIFFLSPTVCRCSTMYRIDPPHLCWAMENLAEGRVVNQIIVPEEEKGLARLALERMLSL